MSNKNAGFRVLLKDVGVGVRFALRNIISFVLGILGVLIVAGLLISLIVVVIVAVVIGLAGDIHTLMVGLMQFFQSVGSIPSYVVVGTVLLFVLPILLPAFVASGAIFGMGREVIETNGTNAGGVLTWYRRKFVPLSIGGAIYFLMIVGPPIAVMYLLGAPTAGVVTDGPLVILAVFSAVWFLVVSGMLSMMFPAIIDGHSPLEALGLSLQLSRTYFDRVFSTWYAYVVITALLMLPMMLFQGHHPGPPMLDPVLGAYNVIAMLFSIFVVLPAATISLSRVYLILTGESGEDESGAEAEEPDIDLVGDG